MVGHGGVLLNFVDIPILRHNSRLFLEVRVELNKDDDFTSRGLQSLIRKR
jgi:hypothetical protein